MPRRQVKRGGRKFQPEKPLIYVFCEGESEQAYAKFLKEHFEVYPMSRTILNFRG